MSIQRILQVWDLFKSDPPHPIKSDVAASIPNSPRPSTAQRTYIAKDGSTQIERRASTDRRQHERRKVVSHPYLDTRKNNGRRRSFGRRLRDQDMETPF
ncbi:hypothetical protein [Undibacterium sp. Di24W]|uniref:hypothetical protein n=1 Tax=Undibacterium sp. Di24W TaxID=3413033 RepID=UPI003BF0FD85